MTNPPTPPYTEATVELVGSASYRADWHYATEADWATLPADEREGYCRQAKAALDALATAGLLLPEGAETRTEYSVNCQGKVCIGGGCARRHYTGGSIVRAQRIARTTGGVVQQRSVGPWTSTTAEGGGVADQSKDPDHA